MFNPSKKIIDYAIELDDAVRECDRFLKELRDNDGKYSKKRLAKLSLLIRKAISSNDSRSDMKSVILDAKMKFQKARKLIQC